MIQFSEFHGQEKVTVEISYIYTRIHTTCGEAMWFVICPELGFDMGIGSAAEDNVLDCMARGRLCSHLDRVGIEGLPSVAMPAEEVQWATAKYRAAQAIGKVPTTDCWDGICEIDENLHAMIVRSEVSAYRKKPVDEFDNPPWLERARSCLVLSEGFNLTAAH